MAVTDAYASAAEYRDRVEKSATGDDTPILVQLTAVSRYLDRRLGRFFTQDAEAVARTLDGNGEARLWVPDIATITGLLVKVDLDADYDFDDSDETLTINTHFWVGPANADKGPEPNPYLYLQIVPNNGRLSKWPDQLRSVEVTAKHGWPAVPGAIKEASIVLVHQLRDLEQEGFTMSLESIDSTIRSSPQMSAFLLDLEERYARRRWFA